jgi:hypothetical protein
MWNSYFDFAESYGSVNTIWETVGSNTQLAS